MTQWFRGKELSLALGICIAMPRLGSSLNSFLSPRVYEAWSSLGLTFLIGLMLLGCSLASGLTLINLDKEMVRREVVLGNEIERDFSASAAEEDNIKISDIKKLKRVFWILLVIGSLGDSLVIAFLDNGN